MKPTRILGVDPGVGGAIALFCPVSHELTLHRMPTTKSTRGGTAKTEVDGYALGILIDSVKHTVVKAVIEQVSGRPGQAGQFQFGLSTGVVHGVIYANLIPLQLVSPAKWKAAMGLRKASNQTKADAKSDARRLAMMKFPKLVHEFQRVKDDGVAEAALIALYGVKSE